MITIKERNGLTINTPDAGEKTLFLDTDSKLKTKDESGVIEEVSIVSATTPKVYKALLTQTGTDDPVATVLENTLGGNLVWSRDDFGRYTGTLVNTFPDNKTIGNILSNGEEMRFNFRFNSNTSNNNTVNIITSEYGLTLNLDGIEATSLDGLLFNSPVSIEIYP